MTTDPKREKQVIADIEALEAEWAAADEAIAAGLRRGPVDDYSMNYYPKCPRCHCDWHGIACKFCSCAASDGEVMVSGPADDPMVYTDQIQGVQTSAPWVVYHDRPSAQSGYTISDLEAMRGSWVLPDYPQRYVMGVGQSPPRVRFWAQNPDGLLHMIEGTATVMSIDWNRNGVQVSIRMDPVSELVTDASGEVSPAGTLQAGMVSMEGATPEGFEPVGYLHPEDIDIRTDEEYVHAWGGETVRTTRETHIDAVIRINDEVLDPVMRRLGQELP